MDSAFHDEVVGACEQLIGRSEAITSTAVRKELGSGSIRDLEPIVRQFRERLRDRLGSVHGPGGDLPEVKPAIWTAFVHFWHQASNSIEREVETRLNARFTELTQITTELDVREAAMKAELADEVRRTAESESARRELEAELRWKEEKIDELAASVKAVRSEGERLVSRVQATEMEKARLEEAMRLEERYRIEQARRFSEEIGRERERFDSEIASQKILAEAIATGDRRTFDFRLKEVDSLLEEERDRFVALEADRAALASALLHAEARQRELVVELNGAMTQAAQGALASAEAIRMLAAVAEEVSVLCERGQQNARRLPGSVRKPRKRKRGAPAANS